MENFIDTHELSTIQKIIEKIYTERESNVTEENVGTITSLLSKATFIEFTHGTYFVDIGTNLTLTYKRGTGSLIIKSMIEGIT